MNVRPGTYKKTTNYLILLKIATQSVSLKLIHKVKLFGLVVYDAQYEAYYVFILNHVESLLLFSSSPLHDYTAYLTVIFLKK